MSARRVFKIETLFGDIGKRVFPKTIFYKLISTIGQVLVNRFTPNFDLLFLKIQTDKKSGTKFASCLKQSPFCKQLFFQLFRRTTHSEIILN